MLQAAMEDRDRLLSLMVMVVMVGQVRGIHVTTRSEDSLVREGEVSVLSYIALSALSTRSPLPGADPALPHGHPLVPLRVDEQLGRQAVRHPGAQRVQRLRRGPPHRHERRRHQVRARNEPSPEKAFTRRLLVPVPCDLCVSVPCLGDCLEYHVNRQ